MQTLTKTDPKLAELRSRLTEIDDINSAAAVLYWDQATYMPAAGSAARGRQLATLRQIAHEKFTDPALGQLLEDLKSQEADLPYDSDEASLIRITRRDYERAVNVPAEFMARVSRHRAESYDAWARARPANDFSIVQPHLEKTLSLSQELASFYPGYEHIADPLIDRADYGLTAASLKTLFAQLRRQLIPIVEAIAAQPGADASCLHQTFAESDQLEFTVQVLNAMGYDFQRGRQDKTLHPFTIGFSIDDVRITTRVKEDSLPEALFSSVHEMGHAFYELGSAKALEATPLAGGVSAGVHESQSRLWENVVARSRPFWRHFYPQIQARFPQQLQSVSPETFYQAINKVERSPIRTDADEVTYNLHIAIRFDLELAMLEGRLAIRDLPDAWNERYRTDLGIVPRNDSEGVLQDVHWYHSYIGGQFQGYTLGNLLSAQFFEAAMKALPDIPNQIEQGNFSPLHQWLQRNIYQHGSKFTPTELIEQVTGSPLSIDPFIRYLQDKYGELYTL